MNPSLRIFRMGVMNITPNSFSDGGELTTPLKLLDKLKKFGKIEALDIGAESTAPFNQGISAQDEWDRFVPFLPVLKTLNIPVSIDTYHSETINKMAQLWLDEKLNTTLIWNDVSGKFDQSVENFLGLSEKFNYVFCHNLAPSRELTGHHMDYQSPLNGKEYLQEMSAYFRRYLHPRVIFDPGLGFSKSYQQNWFLVENFAELQKNVGHHQWLLGFSRKSFIRRKLGIDKLTDESAELLDAHHQSLVEDLRQKASGELWIRTHRPELVK